MHWTGGGRLSAGLRFKVRYVLDPSTGSLTGHQAISGARMSWNSVTNTELSCQQPKIHSLYMVSKANANLEKTIDMVYQTEVQGGAETEQDNK